MTTENAGPRLRRLLGWGEFRIKKAYLVPDLVMSQAV